MLKYDSSLKLALAPELAVCSAAAFPFDAEDACLVSPRPPGIASPTPPVAALLRTTVDISVLPANAVTNKVLPISSVVSAMVCAVEPEPIVIVDPTVNALPAMLYTGPTASSVATAENVELPMINKGAGGLLAAPGVPATCANVRPSTTVTTFGTFGTFVPYSVLSSIGSSFWISELSGMNVASSITV